MQKQKQLQQQQQQQDWRLQQQQHHQQLLSFLLGHWSKNVLNIFQSASFQLVLILLLQLIIWIKLSCKERVWLGYERVVELNTAPGGMQTGAWGRAWHGCWHFKAKDQHFKVTNRTSGFFSEKFIKTDDPSLQEWSCLKLSLATLF